MRCAPRLVRADRNGNIREDSRLLMQCRQGDRIFTPEWSDLIPLPAESDLFLLPGRHPVGADPVSGKARETDGLAVAAFAAPGHTLSGHPAYVEEADAPALPLFAYGAVGYARGKLWICGRKVDDDPRQRFESIKPGRLERNCRDLLGRYSRNRLVGHIINNCALRYHCPAARNFALGRYEAPLPTSRSCNARCIGCISLLQEGMPQEVTPQCRLEFTPKPQEIAEVMRIHASRERKCPIYSFGQGCEGDPLQNADLLAESIRLFRASGGRGTINCNTNASSPDAVLQLAKSGLTSMRVSLNSARPGIYHAYYRPANYAFADVAESIRTASAAGVFVSLNLLYFPGITDTKEEVESLAELCRNGGVSMIQLRNLNIDPLWFMRHMREKTGDPGPAMGLGEFMGGLKARCPWLRFGYFNPWLGEKATALGPGPR